MLTQNIGHKNIGRFLQNIDVNNNSRKMFHNNLNTKLQLTVSEGGTYVQACLAGGMHRAVESTYHHCAGLHYTHGAKLRAYT